MKNPKLVQELLSSGVKCSPDNILFVIKDSNSKLIWLEIGNERAGLEHILLRHLQDFKNIGYKTKEDIVECLYDVIQKGNIISKRPSKYADGEDVVYDLNGVHYLFSGIGNNGFIVTAFPVSR